jgi:hypothetical protein
LIDNQYCDGNQRFNTNTIWQINEKMVKEMEISAAVFYKYFYTIWLTAGCSINNSLIGTFVTK